MAEWEHWANINAATGKGLTEVFLDFTKYDYRIRRSDGSSLGQLFGHPNGQVGSWSILLSDERDQIIWYPLHPGFGQYGSSYTVAQGKNYFSYDSTMPTWGTFIVERIANVPVWEYVNSITKSSPKVYNFDFEKYRYKAQFTSNINGSVILYKTAATSSAFILHNFGRGQVIEFFDGFKGPSAYQSMTILGNVDTTLVTSRSDDTIDVYRAEKSSPPDFKTNINGAIKEFDKGWVNINGELKEIDKMWTNINGVLREV